MTFIEIYRHQWPKNHPAYPRHWMKFAMVPTYTKEQEARALAQALSRAKVLCFKSTAAAQKVWDAAPYTDSRAARLIARFGV
jgi:hypothetical protein